MILNEDSTLSNKYYRHVSKKASVFSRRAEKCNRKAIRKFSKQERRIRKRLFEIDSAVAKQVFNHPGDSLLQSRVTSKVPNKLSVINAGGRYNAYLDTLHNSLSFLSKVPGAGEMGGNSGKLKSTMSRVDLAEGKLAQIDQAQGYMKERQVQLTEALSKYGGSFSKNLDGIKKNTYYFKERIENYKQLWSHPDRIETQALAAMNKIPEFTAFMTRNSALAALFNLSSTQSNVESLAGLQTRDQVTRDMQQRLSGASAQDKLALNAQMQDAQAQLKNLKDKFAGSKDAGDMPAFKPKEMKSKTFMQRLEFGTNLQFSKSSSFFPSTSAIAGQVAYKLSEKAAVGVGAAFNLGWGAPIKHLQFSSQGYSLRSFMEYKIKRSFFVTGGFEENRQTEIQSIAVLKDWNGWSKSGMIGIEKKYKLSSSAVDSRRQAQGTLVVLFDFLHNTHTPPSSAIVFRTGYNF